MKNYLSLLAAILVIILIASLSFTINQNIDLTKNVKRLESNFEQAGDSIQNLNYTKNELEIYLNKKLDSVLAIKNIQPKQVTKLVTHTVEINNTDTVYLNDNHIVDKSLIKTNFVDSRNCITVSGFVLSTDSFPSIAITSQYSKIETYDITVKRKWYQLWKKKYHNETYTKCGNLKVVNIN